MADKSNQSNGGERAEEAQQFFPVVLESDIIEAITGL